MMIVKNIIGYSCTQSSQFINFRFKLFQQKKLTTILFFHFYCLIITNSFPVLLYSSILRNLLA